MLSSDSLESQFRLEGVANFHLRASQRRFTFLEGGRIQELVRWGRRGEPEARELEIA